MLFLCRCVVVLLLWVLSVWLVLNFLVRVRCLGLMLIVMMFLILCRWVSIISSRLIGLSLNIV